MRSCLLDEVALYNLMRETLVYLTNLGGEETQEVMMGLLKTFTEDAKNPNQRNWNPTVLSRLCWAIGQKGGNDYFIILISQPSLQTENATDY